ncbi:MAG: recombinase family protein [Caulobacterales bacterium]
MTAPKRRCAIYTRTSTEEGLSQDFNSLHAQAEACAAYIASQAGEGWQKARKVYEDGGYSGGALNRPALLELLDEIKSGKIDVVVVYKVDRLTRSLADFAKIVEILDAAGASFVSVTQSFNTTTSMGRLTLNVLLSFAQFEREVTGERIRDKFAASKAKGMWMGGVPPLGYDISNRALVINEPEAETVRALYRRYLEVKSIQVLTEELEKAGVRSKRHLTAKGVELGGVPISRGALTHILANPVYRGIVRHKGVFHAGLHQPIIDEETWRAAQEARGVAIRRHRSLTRHSAMLVRLVFDDNGNPMGPTATRKKGVLYRYYATRSRSVGSISRAPMAALDETVTTELEPLLRGDWMRGSTPRDRIICALQRVSIGSDLVITVPAIAIDDTALLSMPVERQILREGETIVIRCPISMARPRNTTMLIRSGGVSQPRADRSLMRAVALAPVWMKRLDSGEVASIKALARSEKLCVLHTARLLPLAYLAPDLVTQILEGRQPRTLTLTALIAEPLPLDWSAQRARFATFA